MAEDTRAFAAPPNRSLKSSEALSVNTQHDSRFLPAAPSKKPQTWSDSDTEIFYACLEVYGRNLSLFKRQLSHKSLRQIERKFRKEQKRCAAKVADALERHATSPQLAECAETMTHILAHSASEASDTSFDDVFDEQLRLLERRGNRRDSPLPPLDFFLREQ